MKRSAVPGHSRLMSIRFVFFDLGNVLVRFSVDRLALQGAELTGRTKEDVLDAVFGSGLERKVETGEATEEEFYEHFCNQLGVRPDREAVSWAMNDIFDEVEGTQPITQKLAELDFPRGILSNTGPGHWNHCCTFFSFLLERFPVNHVLSYEVGAMKPDRRIYEAAFETAKKAIPDIQPNEILFIDDLEPNIHAAREFGFDGIQYVSAAQFSDDFAVRFDCV